MTLNRFFFLFLVFSVVLGLVFCFLEHLTVSIILVPKFWVIFGFLAVLTLIAYVLSFIGIQKGGEIATYALLGGLIVKMLFAMGFVLVYLLKFRVNSINFALEFFSLYFLFTAFEVYGLLLNLRHQNKT